MLHVGVRGCALGLVVIVLALALLVVAVNGRPSLATPGTTEQVSVDSAANQANASSFDPAISADGRYVAFYSDATNLVSGDTNGDADIFVHDRETGITERVSVDSAGNEGNSISANPAISADGRYVAFVSGASSLVPGDTNDDIDVFVHDRQTGATTRVSVDGAGNQANSWSYQPTISADGRYVVFVSGATNLVPEDTNSYDHIFLHDRDTDGDGIFDEAGAIATKLLTAGGNNHSAEPAMSPDGRYVTFTSWASNLVAGDTNDVMDVFVRDRDTDGDGIFDEAGAIATERVSVDSAGNQGNEESSWPAISGDSRYVAFASWASNLVVGDTNGHHDIFVHDRQTGVTERVSVDSAGNEGNGTSEFLTVSDDGRFVAFQSQASNLVPGDASDDYDVFVHDCQTGVTERVSVDSAGNEGNEWSRYPAISADGRYVAFESWASNLVPGDTNGSQDVFVHDRAGVSTAPPPAPPTAMPVVTPELELTPETPMPEFPPTAVTPPIPTPTAIPPLTPAPAPTPEATPLATPTIAPAMLPATGSGGLHDGKGLPRAVVLAAVAVMAVTAGAWYAGRRRLA
jgi:Tol biopolymer transport system component